MDTNRPRAWWETPTRVPSLSTNTHQDEPEPPQPIEMWKKCLLGKSVGLLWIWPMSWLCTAHPDYFSCTATKNMGFGTLPPASKHFFFLHLPKGKLSKTKTKITRTTTRKHQQNKQTKNPSHTKNQTTPPPKKKPQQTQPKATTTTKAGKNLTLEINRPHSISPR